MSDKLDVANVHQSTQYATPDFNTFIIADLPQMLDPFGDVCYGIRKPALVDESLDCD